MSDDLNSMLSEIVDVNSMIGEIEKKSTKKFWRPTAQKTTIRFLPPWKKDGVSTPYFEHKVHWINGQPYECLNQNLVDNTGHMHVACECPICKMSKALYATKSEEAMSLAKKISAKTRQVAKVIVRDAKDVQDDEPVFYELPYKIFEKFQSLLISKEWGSLVGILDGRDFTIEKEGEGMYTSYDKSTFKPNISKLYSDDSKMINVMNKTKEMSYNSLISFQTSDYLKQAAMDNADIARFFGGQQKVTPVIPVMKTEEPISQFEDIDFPQSNKEPDVTEQPKEEIDEGLKSLLADLGI